jgi:hypothetical protein
MPTKLELQDQLITKQKDVAAKQRQIVALGKTLATLNAALSALEVSIASASGAVLARLKSRKQALIDQILEVSGESERLESAVGVESDEIRKLEAKLSSLTGAESPFFRIKQDVKALADQFPVLLFPLRLETRFYVTIRRRELWVRVYPDVCQTEVTRNYLTDAEWAGAVALLDDPRADLLETLGNNRAHFVRSWVERQRAESGFADALKGRTSRLSADFGVELVNQIPAPGAPTLPDRFLFRLITKQGEERTEVGRRVPKDIALSLGQGTASDGTAWLHDFERAIDAGMAIRIEITQEELDAGWEALVVLGVKTSATPEQSKQLLEDLFENHFYSGPGLALVQQGMPSNNADDQSSGYGWDARYASQGNSRASTPSVLRSNTEQSSSSLNDGQWLSQYLGVDDGLFQKVENGTGTDQRDARAMNTALFPATLGYFLDEMLDPLLNWSQIASVESFFTKYVLGRGTIPVLRIGSQPYGILPASVFSKFELNASDPVRNEIVDRVSALLPAWKKKIKEVKHIRRSESSSDDLQDILSLHPASVRFRQRGLEDAGEKLNAFLSTSYGALVPDLNEWLEDVYFDDAMAKRLRDAGLNPQVDRPEIIFKVLQKGAAALDGPLIEKPADELGLGLTEVFSESEPLQLNYIRLLLEGELDDVRKGAGYTVNEKPLLYLLLRHAHLASFATAGVRLEHSKSGLSETAVKQRYRDSQLLEGPENSKLALMYQKNRAITGSPDQTLAKYLQEIWRNRVPAPPEARSLKTFQTALAQLAPLSKAKLERAFVEHLDCCSYRIDAWINGLHSVQLRKQRLQGQAGNNANQWTKGIYLGAFGYIEDLRPGSGKESAGFILGPSPEHAATGAILSAARLAYSGSASNPFELDLSAPKVRLAKQLLEGVENGQGLPELLGYRFERLLADAQLQELTLEFRGMYPLAEPVAADGTAPPAASVRMHVVDGLNLARDAAEAEPRLRSFVRDQPAEKRAQLNAALARLQDGLDAIKDLLMGEGVFQAAKRNHVRAAGVLDASALGNALPELELLQTPRKGAWVTHRFALHFRRIEQQQNPNSHRAMLEPSLNEWLKGVLPAMKDVSVAVRFAPEEEPEHISLAVLKIEPIDLLYLLDDGNERAMSALDDRILGYLAAERAEALQRHYRLSASDSLLLNYASDAGASKLSLFALTALVRSLRRCLLQARPLEVRDLASGSEEVPEPARVSPYHKQRLQQVLNSLNRLTFTLLDESSTDPVEIRNALVSTWRKVIPLVNIHASFGMLIQAAFSFGSEGAGNARLVADVRNQALALRSAVEQQQRALADLIAAFDEAQEFGRLLGAVRAIFGEDALLLPELMLSAASAPGPLATSIEAALTESNSLVTEAKRLTGFDFPVEDWLRSMAVARERMASAAEVLQLAELVREALPVTPIQLPPTGGSWLAVQCAASGAELEVRDKLLYTFAGPASFAGGLCGVLVDEWMDFIPSRRQNAGLSFQYNRPNSEAPQTLLLATPPKLTGHWDVEDLFDSITDTMTLAKVRAVEPKHLAQPLGQFLPATVLFAPLHDTSISTKLAENLGEA